MSVQIVKNKIRFLHRNWYDPGLHNSHSSYSFVWAFTYGGTGITRGINSSARAGCACKQCGGMGIVWLFVTVVLVSSIFHLSIPFSPFLSTSFLGEGLILD